MYILANLVEASREIGEKIIESDFLEIFMALAQMEGINAKLKDAVHRALGKAMEYGLIKPNPELKQ